MANKLADARRSLVRAQESARKRLADLDAERREIKASIKSLDAALKALEKSSRKQADSQSASDQVDENMDTKNA